MRSSRDLLSHVVFVVALAASAVAFFLMLPGTVSAIVNDGAGMGGVELVLANCLVGVAFYALARRAVSRNLSWPWGWPLAANTLDGIARAWGVWVVVLSAREVGDTIQHFGEGSVNGSYLADAFFFCIVTLVIATPGLFVYYIARRVA